MNDFNADGGYFSWVDLNGNGSTPLQVVTTISDDTGYAYFAALTDQLSDDYTMAWPSTADTAISVGASVGNLADFSRGEELLGIKAFSGRGPRIDDQRGINIVAPDDHYGAAASSGGQRHADFMMFGGTSGALPEVAGAIALLLQVEPSLQPDQVLDRLESSARSDAITGTTPNTIWGAGRLDVHSLLFGQPAPANTAPVAALTLPGSIAINTAFTAAGGGSSDAEDPLDSLTFRWDFEYDGTWDHEATGEPNVTVVTDRTGIWLVKLQVRDSRGWSDEVVGRVSVTPVPVDRSDESPGCNGCNGAGAISWPMLGAMLWLWRRRFNSP